VSHRLRDLADYVLYDTPSALTFTDALNLTPIVDGAYLCMRALEPPTGAEQRLIDALEKANVTVLGSVLNDVPASVLDSYQNYQRYYPTSGGALPASVESTGNGHAAIPASGSMGLEGAIAMDGMLDMDEANDPGAMGNQRSSWVQMPGSKKGPQPTHE
jgi:hypothetical protein